MASAPNKGKSPHDGGQREPALSSNRSGGRSRVLPDTSWMPTYAPTQTSYIQYRTHRTRSLTSNNHSYIFWELRRCLSSFNKSIGSGGFVLAKNSVPTRIGWYRSLYLADISDARPINIMSLN